MQRLTVEGVKEAARLAYDEGRLTAQHPVRRERMCYYRLEEYEGKTYGCAVGVALSEETIAAVRERSLNGSSFMSLIDGDRHLLECDDAVLVRRIQTHHDAWCDAAREYLAEDDQGVLIEVAKRNFLRAIDHRAALMAIVEGGPDAEAHA